MAVTTSTTENSAKAVAIGGEPPYKSFLWSNGATSATATNLVSGTYTVTVTDNLGCTVIGTAIVNPSNSLIGTWILESFENGIPIGQYTIFYKDNCPNLVRGTYTLLNETLIINDKDYSYIENERSITIFASYNPNTCQRIEILGSDIIEDFVNTGNGTYILDGNSLTVTQNGESVTSTINFINSNKLQIRDKVYNRQ